MSILKIVFWGTPDFVVPVLKELLANRCNVVGVFAGNGQVELAAKGLEIKVFKPESLKNGDEVFEQFKSLNPDLCIIAAYGKIIPPRYLAIPKYGFINIHPSLLPKYRGPSPIQTAILNGDPALQRTDASSKTNRSLGVGAGTETGVTIILMDDQIDHGPILAQKPYYLLPTTYYSQAAKELFELGVKLLVEILPKYISGELKPQEQDHNKATFTKMFKREDGRINWQEPTEKIYNQIRALNPEPGTWTTWKNKVINIPTSQVGYPQEKGGAGLIKKVGNDIAVTTGNSSLILDSIQLEGGKRITVKEFINGHRDFVGSVLNKD